MTLMPHLKFVLIGDSGQRDTEIYQQALNEFPERILAVYIRKIGRKDKFELNTINSFKEKRVPLLMVESSKEAEEHAKKLGLIQ